MYALAGQHANDQVELSPAGKKPRNRRARIGVVAAIEPYVPPRHQRRQRSGIEQLQPRRPARRDDPGGHGQGRDFHPVLMAQHGDGERGIVGLVHARKRGQRQCQRAKAVVVFDLSGADLSPPGMAAHEQLGPVRLCSLGNRAGHFARIFLGHQRRSGLGDTGFLEGDPGQWFLRHAVFGAQQESLVIDAERGDAAGSGLRYDIGRIEAPAKPDLDHAGVCRVPREGQKAGRRRDFEKAGVQVCAGIQHFGEETGKQVV